MIKKTKLLKLARFLKKLPEEHFNLSIIDNIWSGPERRRRNMKKIAETFKPMECGAAACAMGWCPAVFPETFRWSKDGLVTVKKYEDEDGDKTNSGFNYGQQFFGLSEHQFDFLFEVFTYPNQHNTTAKEVAERIKDFVEDPEIANLYQPLYL